MARRIVAITGAASGIGWATARCYAAFGDTVVLIDRNADVVAAQASELGSRHVGVTLDVTDEDAIVAAVQGIATRFGGIDVWINNAGIVDPQSGPILDKPLDDTRLLLSTNLEGSFVAAREAGRVMLAQGQGSIVNVSSGAALAAVPGRTAYSMSKAALLGFTRALACEWAGRGIRVNAVLPGYVQTEILDSLIRAGRFDPAIVARAIPLGRLADPTEIAEAIRHLSAATYVTGASLLVDGGNSAFGGWSDASGGAGHPCAAVPAR